MAESQHLFQYDGESENIQECLSEARFAPYMKSAGFKHEYAFNLYLYNARLAKAFLFPLHIMEISLRNRIDKILRGDFSESWPHDKQFQKILTDESLKALKSGIARANTSRTQDIISELSFDFWSNLFRSDYDRTLWQSKMRLLLPNKHKTRREFQNDVKELNKFRNRIAHHEPIHTLNSSQYHSEILAVLEGLCISTYTWVKHFSTIDHAIRTKPSPNDEPRPHLSDRSDNKFTVKQINDKIDITIDSTFFIIKSEHNIAVVLEKKHLLEYLAIHAQGAEIVIDLNDHLYSDLIKKLELKKNFTTCKDNESLSKAKSIFKTTNYIIVSSHNSKISGLIAKSHRQY